jgi:hypothetical protein
MPTETQILFTAGAIAKDLGIPDIKIKKAIKALNLEAAAKKGCCSYYTAEDLKKIKDSLA